MVEELGRGNYGVVYKAIREGLERHFAVKVLTTGALQNEEAQARFEREAKVASKLDHPGIVPVFDIGKEGGLPYFVMEFVPGRPLSSRLKEEGRLPPAEAARLVAALADAMTVAHEQGVIHRDLKPANIMLQAPNHTPRIMDFGLARDSNASMSLTKTGDAIGTPYYMAPEQIRGHKDVDARADVYALGVNLYECLTGRVPFPGQTFMEIAQRIRQGWAAPPTQIVPEIPKRLEEICLQAMALDRDDRYSSARALHEDLIAFLRSSGELEALDPPGDRRSVVIAAAITAVLALLTLLVLGVVLHKQARENEARALIARAGSAEKRPEAESLLARAEALARGDEELLERIRVARDAHRTSDALTKLRSLLQDGAVGELKVHVDENAHLAPVKAEALRVAQQLLQASSGAAAGAALEERALSQLAKARELALDAALLERIEEAERRLRARGHLRRATTIRRRDPQAARELLARAQGLTKDSALRAEIDRALGSLDAQSQLDLAWRACDRGAGLPEILAPIEKAAAAVGEDAALRAEVDLARVAAHYYRGHYARAAELAIPLARRTDRSGYMSRYFRGMSEFRIDRATYATTLRGVINDDPDGVGGLLAAAFVNTVMVANGAPQGETCARRALKLEPHNPDARISLAFALHNQNRYAAAWREAQRALELAPGHPRAYLAKGFVKQASGDLEEARDGYARVIQLTEPTPMRRALLRRAQVSRALRQPKRAIADLSRLLSERPEDLTTLLLRAGVREEAGQDEAALKDWKRAAELSPGQTRRAIRMHRGRLKPKILELLGESPHPPALRASKGPKARAVDPQTPLGKALQLHRRGKPLEAVVAAFESALEGASGEPATTIRIEFADVLYRRGQAQAAIAAARPLLTRKDEIGQRAKFLQAFCQLWAGAPNTLQTFRGAFHQDRETLWGLNAGSAMNVLSNRVPNGIELARAAIAKFPDDVEAYVTLTFALCQRPAHHDEAERMIQRAVAVAPQHARAHLAHAYLLSARRKHDQALAALDRAVAVSQPSPIRHALSMRANLSLSRRPKQALADCDLILERTPRDLQALLIKALALEVLQRRPEADAAWKAGFAANPRAFRALVQRSLNHNRVMLQRVLKLADQ